MQEKTSIFFNKHKHKNDAHIDKRIFLSFLLIATLLIAACSDGSGSKGTGNLAAAEKLTVTNEDVGFALLNSVEPDAEGNIFISPTSALIAMLMVYNGADGETKAEIEAALQIDALTHDEVNEATAALLESLQREDDQLEVTIANSLWLNEDFTFLPEFEQRMKDYFDAEIAEIDITNDASADQINDWVKQSTKDMIEEIVEKPLSPDLLTYIVNALYFKGMWTYEFDENLNFDADFFTKDGEKEVPFMTLDEDFTYLETEQFQAVKLPYSEGEINMQIFLPKEDESLAELLANLTTETWTKWQQDFASDVEGTVFLPKFKLEYETILNESLRALGVESAFRRGGANFSQMVDGTPPLHISEVKQKTAIEVDEKGTEAAAATGVAIEMTSAPLEDDSFTMNINRPFLFAIYDETLDHAIFLGVINEPIANE